MVRIFPLIFILLWSSAFITTKPIIDNSDPFAALAFRFFFVAIGFLYIFYIFKVQSIFIEVGGIYLNLFSSGILFHGFYLGGVFLFYLNRYANKCIAALIVTLAA